MNPKQVEELLMRLIVLSGKSMSMAMQALESYLSGKLRREEFDNLWKQAKDQGVQAHGVQTQLIEWDIKTDQNQTSLLAVHAQDHFMNSHLMIQLGDLFIQQQQQIQQLETRLRQMEGK